MATLNDTSGPNPFFSIGSSKSCKIERKREREIVIERVTETEEERERARNSERKG